MRVWKTLQGHVLQERLGHTHVYEYIQTSHIHASSTTIVAACSVALPDHVLGPGQNANILVGPDLRRRRGRFALSPVAVTFSSLVPPAANGARRRSRRGNDRRLIYSGQGGGVVAVPLVKVKAASACWWPQVTIAAQTYGGVPYALRLELFGRIKPRNSEWEVWCTAMRCASRIRDLKLEGESGACALGGRASLRQDRRSPEEREDERHALGAAARRSDDAEEAHAD